MLSNLQSSSTLQPSESNSPPKYFQLISLELPCWLEELGLTQIDFSHTASFISSLNNSDVLAEYFAANEFQKFAGVYGGRIFFGGADFRRRRGRRRKFRWIRIFGGGYIGNLLQWVKIVMGHGQRWHFYQERGVGLSHTLGCLVLIW